MKVAIVGSRTLGDNYYNDISKNVPIGCSEIISGGAKGVDSIARRYATENGIKLIEILPEYEKYSYSAAIKRNMSIVDASDYVLAFWDGHSAGTRSVINYCLKKYKPIKVIILK